MMVQKQLKTSICAYLLCAASLLVGVHGHGYLSQPPSRNFLGSPAGGRTESQGVLTYTPHGGNGRGVCGDSFEGGGGPFSGLSFGQLRAPTTYTRGQRVTMKMYITAAHGGTFAFQLCDRTSNLDHACFNRFLTRADTGERYWYIFDRGSNREFTMDFVLPNDFSCPNGCVLRWEYYTGNTCVMRHTVQGCTSCGAYANGGVYGVGSAPGLCPVGATLQTGPEVFYNCADVIITGGQPPSCPSPCPTPNTCQTGGGCNTNTRTCNPITNAPNGSPCTGGACQNGACIPIGCPTTCPTAPVCKTGGGCNTNTRTCNPITNLPNGVVCPGGTCQNGVCASGCPATCPTAPVCRTGGGCNTNTRTCNPITNAPNGSPCPGGTCQNGACASGCPTTCPTAPVCKTGGGCNTNTRTCNPITNAPNGSPCTGGTCQNGVCQSAPDPCAGAAAGQARATCFCRNRPLGRYQDVALSCSGGFWCYPGGSQYISCTSDLRYDPIIGVCNWPANVPCDGRVGAASVGLRGARPDAAALVSNTTSTDSVLEQQPDTAAIAAASLIEESAQLATAVAPATTNPQEIALTAAPVEPGAVGASSLEPTAVAPLSADPAVVATSAADVDPAAVGPAPSDVVPVAAVAP